MSAFSNYLEERIVDHFLRGTAVSSPGIVYLALFESDPGEDASGTETSYTNYARESSIWTALDGNGQTKNEAAILFPANGNGAASVTITHAAIFDAVTGGNMLLHGPLSSSKILAPNDVLSFQQYALVLTVN